jgi:hypothetical protein
MFRTQHLVIAALLMSSATAFAADTTTPSSKVDPPDHSSKGSESVLPSGSVEGVASSTPPPAAKLPPDAGQSGVAPDAAPAQVPGRQTFHGAGAISGGGSLTLRLTVSGNKRSWK